MLGSGAVFPLQLGGGPTPTEQAYAQLREAVGVGGSASDDSGIDGLWRWCRAKGLAVASSAERRALLQASPRYATDLLPYYERVLQIVPPAGSTFAERARIVSERWNEQAVASTPDLADELKKIDPRLRILEAAAADAGATQFGRSFEAHDSQDEGPAFNLDSGATHVRAPNWSTHQVVRVRFDLGYEGIPNTADQKTLLRVRKMLRLALPSDTTFTLSTGLWILGVTPVGLGEVLDA